MLDQRAGISSAKPTRKLRNTCTGAKTNSAPNTVSRRMARSSGLEKTNSTKMTNTNVTAIQKDTTLRLRAITSFFRSGLQKIAGKAAQMRTNTKLKPPISDAVRLSSLARASPGSQGSVIAATALLFEAFRSWSNGCVNKPDVGV